MPARLARQDNENGRMEAACPQAVSARLANTDGAPRLHPRYFPGRKFESSQGLQEEPWIMHQD